MKRHAISSLLVLAIAAFVLAGCGPQTSTPLAATPATKPAANLETPQNSPVVEKLGVEKKKDTFGEERDEEAPIIAPFESPPAEAPTGTTSHPSTAAKPPANLPDSAATRPKADREPTRPGDPEKITFDDLILGMQADMVYRPFMLTDRAKELEGKRVRLSGDMWPYDASKKVKEFIILRNNKCLYGKRGQADHVALVLMKEGHTIAYTSKSVRIEGNLKIVPVNGDDGNTKHLYVLEDAVAK